jgi:hypothetical protein
MRKLLLAAGLMAILVWILVLDRTLPWSPVMAVAPQPQDEPPAAGQPADQLIVAAVSADAAIAWPAYRDLEQIGHCPNLADSPESPVGLLAAAYGGPDSDAQRVRDAILLLVKQGCDINQYSAVGLTPLHGAVIGRQPDLLRILLEQGADPMLRVIPIPGNPLDRSIAHLDAYGVALVLRKKFPADAALHKIQELLKPAA